MIHPESRNRDYLIQFTWPQGAYQRVSVDFQDRGRTARVGSRQGLGA